MGAHADVKPFRLLLVNLGTPIDQDPSQSIPMVLLPLGLMYLSAVVKERFGSAATIRLIDSAVDWRGLEAFEKIVLDYSPDIVGIRVLSVAESHFTELVSSLQAVRPEAILVAGGPHPSQHAVRVMTETPVDYIISGEGEYSFSELLAHLFGDRPAGDIKGLFSRVGETIELACPQEAISDLDRLPLPDYDLIDQEKYSKVLSMGSTLRSQALMLSSRGCPYRCKYCLRFMGDQFRPRSVESVVDEIDYIVNTRGVDDIFIVDDNFNLIPDRVLEICESIQRRGLRRNYYFPVGLKADLLTEELVDHLVDIGTCQINYSVETACPRIAEQVGRKFDLEKAAHIIDYTADKNVMVAIAHMIGFPGETYEEAMVTLRYVQDRKHITMPYLFAVRYFPGTQLAETALDAGAIDHDTVAFASQPFHNILDARTSTLSTEDFQSLFTYYMKNVLLNPERLRFALDVQEKHLTGEEISQFYSYLLGKKIKDPRRTFRYILEP